MRFLFLDDQIHRIPDPGVVDTDETRPVRGAALGDRGAGAHDDVALDPGGGSETVAPERLLEGLLNDGVVVAAFAGPSTDLIAYGGGQVRERVVGQSGGQVDCRLEFVGEALQVEFGNLVGHRLIMPAMTDSPARH